MESEKQVVRAAAYVRLSARELTQDNTFALIFLGMMTMPNSIRVGNLVHYIGMKIAKIKTKRICRVCQLSLVIAKPEKLMWFL